MLLVNRIAVNLSHNTRCIFQILDGFKQWHDIHFYFFSLPSGKQKQSIHFDNIQFAVTLADDITVTSIFTIELQTARKRASAS